MLPVGIIGVLFKDSIEQLFNGNIMLVGTMLLITGIVLASTTLIKVGSRPVTFPDALIIGIAQAIAIIPGISRSGATVATSLLIGNKREDATRFAFLMALIPIIGANLLDFMGEGLKSSSNIETIPLIVGFVAAFIIGLVACKLMINIVKRGKLMYFAVYCLLIGLIAIIYSFKM
jgi:undecaprenyl-diphosphatase